MFTRIKMRRVFTSPCWPCKLSVSVVRGAGVYRLLGSVSLRRNSMKRSYIILVSVEWKKEISKRITIMIIIIVNDMIYDANHILFISLHTYDSPYVVEHLFSFSSLIPPFSCMFLYKREVHPREKKKSIQTFPSFSVNHDSAPCSS